MPGNVAPAAPTDVLPRSLMSAFVEELRIEANVNAYPDGSSQRAALQLNPRRFFRLAPRVDVDQWVALRDFYFAHRGLAFWYYVPRETVPPFSFDPTGANPTGRLAVVFDGSWSETFRMGRSDLTLGIREVA